MVHFNLHLARWWAMAQERVAVDFVFAIGDKPRKA